MGFIKLLVVELLRLLLVLLLVDTVALVDF